MPDDHSKLVPLLPIPNRTVKRLSADDSADSCVKVGHRQAIRPELAQLISDQLGFFFWVFNFRMIELAGSFARRRVLKFRYCSDTY